MNRIYFVFVFIFLTFLSYSQKIENVHAEQVGNKVMITYNLTGAESNQKFYVSLYYSQNGYNWSQSIYGLTGDIGDSIVSGNNKSIIWDALKDVDRLTGSGFMFKVKASKTNNNVALLENKKIEDTTFTDTGGEGIPGTKGEQGNLNDTPNYDKYIGSGSSGGGLSYSLAGRSPKYLPKPAAIFKENGTVVVQIDVDKYGKVIKALAINKGSNTTDETLRNLAEQAAKQAIFNANPDAIDIQRGTITYHFVVKK